jgi:hypothetical protein
VVFFEIIMYLISNGLNGLNRLNRPSLGLILSNQTKRVISLVQTNQTKGSVWFVWFIECHGSSADRIPSRAAGLAWVELSGKGSSSRSCFPFLLFFTQPFVNKTFNSTLLKIIRPR